MINANLMWEQCTVRYVEAKNRNVSFFDEEKVFREPTLSKCCFLLT